MRILNFIKRNPFEEKLTAMVNEFKTISRAVNEVIWDLDIRKKKLIWGDGLSQLFGYSKHEYPTLDNFKDFVHPSDYETVKIHFNSELQDKNRGQWESKYRFKNINGEYRYISDHAIILRNNKGRPIRIIGSMKDLSVEIETIQKKNKLIKTVLLKERKNISMELHDNLGQHLVALNLYLNKLNSKGNELYFKKCSTLLQDCIQRTRTICYDLSPTELNNGIISGLKSFTTDLNQNTNIDFQLIISEKISNKSFQFIDEYQNFRIIQEFINNSIKHSKCDEIIITISKKNESIYLSISDNGIGFNLNNLDNYGLGIYNMIERAEIANSILCYSSCKSGTSLYIKLMEAYNH